KACGARRLAIESVAFTLPGASGDAVSALELGARSSGLETLVLRFGQLWGPGTWSASAPQPPAVHIEEAGRRAAELVLRATPGTYVIA
ncbi:MAG TPA: hypothetical protein VGP93_08855, partial [Polyangiaceae bacterium]|nr:hypothetical protein [Polyangiaceae bacterium]